MKAEQFIKDYTNHCSNLLVFAKGDKEYDYAPWLTPEQALSAVAYAKEEWLEKACKYLQLFTGLDDNKVEQFKEYMEK